MEVKKQETSGKEKREGRKGEGRGKGLPLANPNHEETERKKGGEG